MHVFEREVGGELTAIVRCEMGTLRKHRGRNVMFSFMVDRMLRYLVAHPLRPLYILGSLVHPSSYAQLARYTDEVWPRAEAETPAEILDLMDQLGDAFGIDRVDPDNALVRKVGWQTMDSAGDRAYWERSERRGVRYFLDQNPGYAEGHGLLTIAPVSLGIVARGLGTYARQEGERRARKLATRARAALATATATAA